MSLSLKSFFLTLFFFTLPVQSAEIVEQYLSVKALGMGNAYLAHARAEDAVFYNPAGLSKLSGFRYRAVGLGLGINGIDSYDEYADIIDSAQNDLANAFNSLYGRNIYGRTDVVTSMSFGSLILGAFAIGNAGFELFNPAFPVLETSYFADYGLFVGWGTTLVPKYLDFGIVGKRITRMGGDIDLGASTIAGLDSDELEELLLREGTGYAVDTGLTLTLPSSWNPSVNVVWRNVGQTSFDLYADDPPPPALENQIDLGIGFYKDFGLMDLRAAVDYRGVNQNGEEPTKRAHMGLELGLPLITLRGGYNQGYYTAGASMNLWIFQLDAATYGVELGEYAGQDEDRRYSIQLSLDFGIDPSGNWFNQNRSRSKRARLKQRR